MKFTRDFQRQKKLPQRDCAPGECVGSVLWIIGLTDALKCLSTTSFKKKKKRNKKKHLNPHTLHTTLQMKLKPPLQRLCLSELWLNVPFACGELQVFKKRRNKWEVTKERRRLLVQKSEAKQKGDMSQLRMFLSGRTGFESTPKTENSIPAPPCPKLIHSKRVLILTVPTHTHTTLICRHSSSRGVRRISGSW